MTLKQDIEKNQNKWNELISRQKKAAVFIVKKIDYYNKEKGKVREEPIEHMKYRIKSIDSIEEKLIRNKKEVNIENAFKYLNDISGIRLVCPFESDIEEIKNFLFNQESLEIIKTKDFINNPKPNGYKSYHMIVKVIIDNKPVIVEIQIRSLAMDFWATLEHQIKYKKRIKNEELVEFELKRCADEACLLDKHMQDLNKIIKKE